MDPQPWWLDAEAAAALGIILLYHYIAESHARRPAAAKFTTTVHDRMRLFGVDLGFSSSALTIAAFVGFAFFPFAAARWAAGRLALPPAARWALLGCMLAAIRLRYAAMTELGAFFSRTLNTVQGQRVIRSGPFAWVRHPGYAANWLLYLSASLVIAQNAIAWLVTLACFAAIWSLRIRREEAMMVKAFGQEYIDYQKTTARFIPFVY